MTYQGVKMFNWVDRLKELYNEALRTRSQTVSFEINEIKSLWGELEKRDALIEQYEMLFSIHQNSMDMFDRGDS
jgi:hypothetical protein